MDEDHAQFPWPLALLAPAATGLLVAGARLVRPGKTRWGIERGYRELTTDPYRTRAIRRPVDTPP
ncbi:hypothetical protein [Blastococcus goldschmidtiae]|uniref:Uncharacterized protein n=1 Tax=Blastococcus goldschmidtiae TaxID=3075546 RepID=A0ABU2K720_9ACTN|nr:hypothetical protein [Blastococcus sp. DSM 46792]MDT0275973.1 hypothetical protein [Blastococcus sp. DSM 46792]